jgi:hypothetical protein
MMEQLCDLAAELCCEQGSFSMLVMSLLEERSDRSTPQPGAYGGNERLMEPRRPVPVGRWWSIHHGAMPASPIRSSARAHRSCIRADGGQCGEVLSHVALEGWDPSGGKVTRVSIKPARRRDLCTRDRAR